MRRSYDYHENSQYGWNTTSQEYLEHLARIERMPSVIGEVPHYPSIYKAFNNQVNGNQVACEEEHEDHLPRVNLEKHQAPEAQKKVHFVEPERKATEVDRNRRGEVHKDLDVNTAADGFINQKRKNFTLDHVTRMERKPSIVCMPLYPNLHMISKNRVNYNEECGHHNVSCSVNQVPNSQKKVQSAQHDEATEVY